MLERCLELLSPAATSGGIIIDATLGLGGHSAALLTRFPEITVIGVDRDAEALSRATERLKNFTDRFVPVHAVYDTIPNVVEKHAAGECVAGVLFDLGVSSMQLDFAERGFSYAQDAPLDMRMDRSSGKTARELVAELDAAELATLFRRYGDEPLATRYATAIVAARKTTRVDTSAQLVEILQEATPAKLKSQRHPAKRVFQALRVAVNDELQVLQRALPAAADTVSNGGRIVCMAYQSHEDKIVKQVFRELCADRTPTGLPQQLPEYAPEFKQLTRGAERASAAEQTDNTRSIPARLRAVERVRSA